jgi:hypothetical protein
MHPEVRSDREGTCPKCGMKLEKQEGATVESQTDPKRPRRET